MNDNSRKTLSNPFYLNINHIFLIFLLLFLQPQSTASQTEKKEKKKICLVAKIIIHPVTGVGKSGGKIVGRRERGGQVKRAKFIADTNRRIVYNLSRTKSISHGHVIIIAPCNQSQNEWIDSLYRRWDARTFFRLRSTSPGTMYNATSGIQSEDYPRTWLITDRVDPSRSMIAARWSHPTFL